MEKPVYIDAMWINIDRERMVITHKHPDRFAVDNLAFIELGHSAVVTMDINHTDGWKAFTDFELKLLHENISGQKHNGFQIDALVNDIKRLAFSVNVSVVNTLELAMQADKLTVKRDKDEYYKYIANSTDPDYVAGFYAPPALTINNHIPEEKIKNYVSPKPIGYINVRDPVISGNNPHIKSGSDEPKVRTPRSDNVTAPTRDGSKTGKVWAIADELLSANPGLDIKSLRKLVMSRCEEEGVNSSTASVQFSKWKSAKNL